MDRSVLKHVITFTSLIAMNFLAGCQTMDHAANNQIITPTQEKAKNVILFIGDGMGVSTVTAARIYDGQTRGESGEENFLS